METKEFFTTHWYRDTLIESILKLNSSYEEKNKSFNLLRLDLAILLFGEEKVNSIEFKKSWIEAEIETFNFCIERDSKQLEENSKIFGKNKFKNRSSVLPDSIKEDKKELLLLKSQLLTPETFNYSF